MNVALLGAGGYGTALLRPLVDNGHRVSLWDRDPELIREIRRLGYNPRYPYLRSFSFPALILPTSDLADAVADAEVAVCAVSIAGLTHLYPLLADAWPRERPLPLIGISKGITADGRLPDELARAAFQNHALRYVHLAGPAFAQELAFRAPVGLVAASAYPEAISICRALLGIEYLWVYATDDVRGVESAAAIRTILSFVFGGLAAAPTLARSSKAFIFSRAQAEIARFGLAMGGAPETFAMDSPCAPASLGDLYLCDDPGSRNWQLGHKVTSGLTLDAALTELQGVAECVGNAEVVHRLAERFRADDPDWALPWCEAVYRVCHEGSSIEAEIESIRARIARLM